MPSERLLDHLAGMQERGLLRRVAAILYHRRAGFSRQRHGRVEGARGADLRHRPADGRRARHLPLLPAPHVRGLALLGLHDGPRPLQGGVRRRARRDRRADRHPRARHALLIDRVQEDPAAVLHRGLRGEHWDARALRALVRWPRRSPTRAPPSSTRARRVLPGGVNSPVRAMRSIGRDPIFIERGQGAELIDVDGNRYVDYVCSWGPLIHGHAHPAVLAAIEQAAARARGWGAHRRRDRAREEVARRMRGSRWCA